MKIIFALQGERFQIFKHTFSKLISVKRKISLHVKL